MDIPSEQEQVLDSVAYSSWPAVTPPTCPVVYPSVAAVLELPAASSRRCSYQAWQAVAEGKLAAAAAVVAAEQRKATPMLDSRTSHSDPAVVLAAAAAVHLFGGIASAVGLQAYSAALSSAGRIYYLEWSSEEPCLPELSKCQLDWWAPAPAMHFVLHFHLALWH